jgi:acyl-CoA synthetase (AMP-forming)/AMP-acid ligase II/thioesterase domain-containing protein
LIQPDHFIFARATFLLGFYNNLPYSNRRYIQSGRGLILRGRMGMAQDEVGPCDPCGHVVVLANPVRAEAEPQDWSSIHQSIRLHAARSAQAPALVGADFETVTYRALSDLIDSAALQLAQLGLGPTSRVGLLVPAGYRGALLVLALAAHVQLVPLNPALTEREIAEEAARMAMDALVFATDVMPVSSNVHEAGPLRVKADFGSELDIRFTPIGGSLVRSDHAQANIDSIALLLRSSGTTGEPKHIPVTHRNLVAMSRKMANWFDIGPDDRIPCTLPLHYAAGLKTALFVPLLLGASVGIPRPESIYDLSEWIEKIKPTILSIAPASLRNMVDRWKMAPERPQLPFLRFAICGAAYLPDALRREAEAKLGVPVIEYYGLSEAGAMAANPAPPRRRKPGTVGLVPDGELILMGEDGLPVQKGEIGEITIRGPSVTPGYVTAHRREPLPGGEGWLSTGDLGILDADNYLTIVGRSKEIINRGGEKVSPYEVEKALLRHPAILEAGVFSVPHPRLGENVAAAIVLRPGHQASTYEIRQSLTDRLARFKIPQTIHTIDAMPRGPTGKVDRKELVSRFAAIQRHSISEADRMLEHQILAIWTRLLGRNDIGIDDDFFESGGDSLLAAEMLSELELVARRKLPQSRLVAEITIRGLADTICLDLEPGREWLTKVQDGSGTPLFFCHGDYTTRGLYALRLFDMMKLNRPVYLLHFYEDLHRPDLTIEEIAALYVDEIRRIAPQGPVIIGGYCNGGLVAWQLTHLLRQARVDVRELLLIETPSLNARLTFRLAHRFFGFMAWAVPGRIGDVIQQESMRAFWHRMRGYGSFGSLFSHAFARAWRRILHVGRKSSSHASIESSPHWAYQRTLSRYRPAPIDVTVSCFIALHGRHLDTDVHQWKRLAPCVRLSYLHGMHHSVVTSNAEALGLAIRHDLSYQP